jgi:amino acid adenylation domain-containing protein
MGTDVVTLGTTVDPFIDELNDSVSENTAVTGPDGTVTYAELSVRAAQLAERLRQMGVKPGDLVGLCVDRSASLVVAALGIIKADAAYVAIDPKYPDERIRWMLDDSAATAVVCDADTADRLGTGDPRALVVVEKAGQLRDGPVPDGGRSTPHRILPTDLAYVVYTSGSTGRPKGVMVEHAGLDNLVDWHRTTFSLTADDRCTQIASPGFDAAVWEIWPCLAAGASLHIVPEELRLDPVGLRDWLVAEAISVTFLPTAVADGLIGLGWPKDCSLRFLLTGGDALTRRPAPGLGFTVVNNYGLSETTVVATSGVVASDEEGAPSIGRPIAGVVAEVLDENLQPVEPGVAGELIIGGVAVGRGYLNRPDLTAERFLYGDGGRRYRTGDRVRLRPDGAFEFLGRLDDQLSIRGVRVEPGEVSAALHSHPAIAASVAVGIDSPAGERQLVAYVVSADGQQPDGRELNGFLCAFLPETMLPSKYVWIDELPLTVHGKIDRDALPAPVDPTASPTTDSLASGTKGQQSSELRPRTPTEEAIAPVLAELLDVAEIGVDQNFFLLGGHSMLGAQLIVRLEYLFDVEISLRYLFDHPTLAEIAAEVDSQTAERPAAVPSAG